MNLIHRSHPEQNINTQRIATRVPKVTSDVQSMFNCVMTEWQDSNFLQFDILTTHLFFSDDQVILSASEDSLQSRLHHISETALTCNLILKGKE
jgi:hypothetical protein